MENVTPEQKQPVFKTLALAGLVSIIIFAAWLAIQIVQTFPSAATSLASLANSVYNYNPNQSSDLELASGQTMVNVNEPFTISWKSPKVAGIYTFSYACQEGITLDLAAGDKKFVTSECDRSYDIDTNTSLSLTIASEKNRFAEIPYVISFFRTNATEATATYTGKVTVVNANLFAAAEVATTTNEVIETETDPVIVVPVAPVVPETVIPPVTPLPPVTEETIPPAIITPNPTTLPEPEYIYEIPISQIDGQPDLLVSYLGIGIVDSNGAFIKTETLTQGTDGALQFSVHNIGNKTSKDWTFEANLPGNLEFTSSEQDPLLPNERAVLTLTFKAVTKLGLANYLVTVDTTQDKNSANNTITGSKLVTN